jgi:hypothetical protein
MKYEQILKGKRGDCSRDAHSHGESVIVLVLKILQALLTWELHRAKCSISYTAVVRYWNLATHVAKFGEVYRGKT